MKINWKKFCTVVLCCAMLLSGCGEMSAAKNEASDQKEVSVEEETKQETPAEKQARERKEEQEKKKKEREEAVRKMEAVEAKTQEVLNKEPKKLEWTDELTLLMQQINAEHEAIVKPQVEVANFFDARQEPQLSDHSQIAPLEVGKLTKEQAIADVEMFFATIQKDYGLYNYFGGDEVFLPAKEAVIKACQESARMSSEIMTQIIAEKLSFIKDTHFEIQKMPKKLQIPVFYQEVDFIKTENGYKTADGKQVQSVGGYKNLDEIFKRSLNKDADIVYYPIAMQEIMTEQSIEEPSPLTIQYQDGSSQTLQPKIYEDMEVDGELELQLDERNGVPILTMYQFGFDEAGDEKAKDFVSYGEKLKEHPALILDFRNNGGGNGVLPYKWLEQYTGEVVPSNFYRLSLLPNQESNAGSPYYISEESMKKYIQNQSYHQGTIANTKEDQMIDNENLLIVLSGKTSASSTEEFVDAVHNVKNTLIIGENTTGCFLGDSAYTKELKYSQLQYQFGASWNVFPEGYFEEGRGIEPDFWVPAPKAEEAAVKFIEKYMK